MYPEDYLSWDLVASNSEEVLSRTKVIGGYLYKLDKTEEYRDRYTDSYEKRTLSSSITFVPCPEEQTFDK